MKTVLTAIAFFLLQTINAQDFQGKAIYKTSSKNAFEMSSEKNSAIDDKMQKEIQRRIQKMSQKTFVLEFDKYSSTYKQEVTLSMPKTKVGGNNVMVMSFGGASNTSVYYKNIKEKRFVNGTEIMGKRFLVKDKLPSYDWELSSETKNIGLYTCYKASFSKEIEDKKISFKDGKTLEEVTQKTVVTTAWYTPEVSVSNGPGNYQGLPGLILEINDGIKTIICSEIILNPIKKNIIIEPKKGKVVSQKKFIKIQNQKSDEMMEKFKSRKGLDMGNGMNIKIGG